MVSPKVCGLDNDMCLTPFLIGFCYMEEHIPILNRKEV